MLKWISSMVVLAIVASGCSVTADGIGPVHHAPDPNKIAQLREQLQENAAFSAAEMPSSSDRTRSNAQPGILVVGMTGPFRTIEEKARSAFYAAYLKAAG